jgi:chromosome segregation ATPase
MAVPVLEGGIVGFLLALAFAFFRHYRALKQPITRLLKELGVEDPEQPKTDPEKQTTRDLLETCAAQLIKVGDSVDQIASDVEALGEAQERIAADVASLHEWKQRVDETLQRHETELVKERAARQDHEARLVRLETAVAMRGTDLALARAANPSGPLTDAQAAESPPRP